MRTILITAIIILSILMLLSFWIRFEPLPRGTVVLVRDELQEQLQEAEEIKEVPEIVANLNAKNALIENFSCERINVKTWQKGLRVRLSATMFYEKPMRFRLQVSTAFGTELDLGANDEIFWYWSRRDSKPGLYWAKYEDYHKTRLKTPFNPVFMRESLGLDTVDIQDVRISETDKYTMLIYDRYNSMGQPILYSILINKISGVIDGILVTDTDGVPLATADIKRYSDGLPKQILYTWHEEDRLLSLEFEQPQVNTLVPVSHWVPPDKEPKIDMAKE